MSEDIKLEVIRNTQDSLSKYIKKPPLTEKLLRKPPFRYLHDITTSVMRETGYLNGLYSQDELNPENIKDRDAKIAFLEKLIAAVNLSTGANITARPNKIVAGLDVAKTNELLQTIAKALEKRVDSSTAVEQVLSKKNKGTTQQNSSKKDISKGKTSKETKTVEAKTREPRTSDALKKKNKDKLKHTEKTDTRRTKSKKDLSPTKLSKIPSIEEPSTETAKDDFALEKENLPDSVVTVDVEKTVTSDVKVHSPEPKLDVNPPLSPTPALEPPPPTPHRDRVKTKNDRADTKDSKLETTKEAFDDAKQDHGKDDKLKPDEELRRPQSARANHRKKPTKKPSTEEDVSHTTNRDTKEEIEGPVVKSLEVFDKKPAPVQSENTVSRDAPKRPKTAARPASARPGAPRVRDRGTVLLTDTDNRVANEPVNLIVDSKDVPKDDDETLVTVEATTDQGVVDQAMDESHVLMGDQGHLVSQILETQKELEDTSITTSEATTKVDITWSTNRQREQETVRQEVDKLRTAIQALTRAANPLGKLIDFLQEDVDSMQTELETWTATNSQLAKQLHAEQRLTEESIEPLARQLEEIDQLVEEQLEEMSVVKAAIIRNDERLDKLLKSNTARLPG